MARNEVFNLTTTLADSSTGNLTAFSTSDFTQLVTQVTGPSGTYVLQVSPDGINWYDEASLSVGAGQVVAVSDIAFAQGRIRFALSGTGGTATIRVLGRF